MPDGRPRAPPREAGLTKIELHYVQKVQKASQRNEQQRTPDAEGRLRHEAEAKKKKAKAPEVQRVPPEEYDLTIRHAVEEGEVQLRVWSNWTFASVRKALAKKLGRDDIQKKARFVFRTGDGSSPWLSFKDHKGLTFAFHVDVLTWQVFRVLFLE